MRTGSSTRAGTAVNRAKNRPETVAPTGRVRVRYQGPCCRADKRVQFGYGLNYLIDIANAVIVDVEATPARTYDEVAAVTSLFGELAAKQVGLLHELVPGANLIAYLVNPSNPIAERNARDAVDAAQKLGEKIEIVHASSEAEIDAAFDTMRGMRASALLVQLDAFLVNKRIVALAARDALPTMYQTRELVAAGGLMSYGSSLADMYRQMGVYVGKVLGGANPAELPVLQPTKFEMAINLKTAKALGLKLSDNLLSLADEVIE